MGALLAEAGCAERAPLAAGASVGEWSALLAAGRPAFLNALKALGFDKLAERQKVANVLGKARREGRA